MDILLSIIGSAVLAVLLATAYTAGVAAGKAAAHVDDEESKIYMPHTHGGDPDTLTQRQPYFGLREVYTRGEKQTLAE